MIGTTVVDWEVPAQLNLDDEKPYLRSAKVVSSSGLV
jgi:hypothetical protein